ncbi:MAG TPA: ATP synthase F0 subunit B [Nitrospirota bacterium]|nr:ATP synthase F0 subunit B [Nitrospirota bacterium]
MNVFKKLAPFWYGVFGVVQSSLAPAQEEASHGGEDAITFLGDWLPRLVNFAIITAVVVYFTRKPIRDFFKNRSAEIAKAMQESKETRERAAAALAEMERKIKDLEIETSRLIADAQARGEKDKLALIEEGKKAAQDIQAQARQGIDLEVMKAKAALAAEAARLSLDLAEGKIKDNIGRQDQDRIVKDYISKVGGKA